MNRRWLPGKQPSSRRHTKKAKRPTWQNLRNATPFVIMCGVIALLYLVYRLASVAVPAALVGKSFFVHDTAHSFVCKAEGDDTKVTDPVPIFSADYQQRLQRQVALNPNRATNPTVEQVDQNGQPVGFSHSADTSDASYQSLQDPGDPQQFLRVSSSVKRGEAEVKPSWLMAPVPVEKDATYAYSFAYRSNVKLQLATEVTRGETHRYASVTELSPSGEWQQFTAHFDNTEQAESFRFTLTTTEPGQVDVRGFDVHQIQRAELQKGIVSLTFDDGWQSVDDKAAGLLQKYNMRSTLYIISEVSDKHESGYMSLDTIKRLKQAGHEVGSHTTTHCNLTKLSPVQLNASVIDSKHTLEANQLGPTKSFAYPLGQYNAATQLPIAKTYQFVRSSDAGFNDRYFDRTNIHSMGLTSSTTEAEFSGWLKQAAEHKLWLVLVYHRIDESGAYNISSAELEKQLQLIKQSGLTVLPLAEAAEKVQR